MAHKRLARVRYHSVRGGHYGAFGPRYLGYHMAVRHGRKRRRRTRGNPFYFPNPGRGTNWLLIGVVAVGAFFLMRGGGLTNLFGGGVPAGYTQLGTSGYYRGPDGQLYTRTAAGGMVRSATQAPAGSAVEQQLIAAGSRLALPIVGGLATGLSTMLSNLFTGGSATGAIPAEGGATTVTAPDVLSGAYSAPGGLAPLPDLPSLQVADWWSAPESASWWAAPSSGFSLGAPEPMGLPPLEPLPEPGGFFGFGATRYPGYGLARYSPSGEVEARFLRQPPSYR